MKSRMRIILGSIICSLAALFYVYDYFIQVAPSVMVSDLMRDFKIGAGDLGVLSACFFYSYALMQVPAGWALDRLGARRLLSIAILVCASGVFLFSQATSFPFACLGRFLIGLGSAFSFVSTLFLISRWFSHKQFTTLAGLVQLGACLGSIVGLAPIAFLVDQYGWRNTMWVTGFATLGLAVMTWLVVRDSPAIAAAEPIVESSAAHSPPLKLIRHRQLWLICACGFFCWIPVAGVGALWGVPYMMKVYGLSNTMAGSFVTWFWIGLGLGSPIVGYLSHYFSQRKIPLVICFVCAIAASILLLNAAHLPFYISIFALFLLGCSASAQSLTFGVLKDIVPQAQFGFASGILNMSAIAGGGLAQPLIGLFLRLGWDGHYAQGIPVYTLGNYEISLGVLPAVAVLGLIAACFIKETHCVPVDVSARE